VIFDFTHKIKNKVENLLQKKKKMIPISTYKSSNPLHSVDSLCSNNNNLFCATFSTLVGDIWDGEVRIFKITPTIIITEGSSTSTTTKDKTILQTETALHIPCGVSCSTWLSSSSDNNTEAILVGCDDGNARIIARDNVLESNFFIEKYLFGEHDDIISTVANDGHICITGSWDGIVKVWDLAMITNNNSMVSPILTLNDSASCCIKRLIKCSAVSIKHQAIFIGDSCGHVERWDLKTGQRVVQIQLPMINEYPTSMQLYQVDHDNSCELLIGTSLGTLFILDGNNNFSIIAEERKRHSRGIGAIAISTIKGDVITGSDDGMIYGNQNNNKCIDFIRGVTFCTLSSQSSSSHNNNNNVIIPITGCWDGSITLWLMNRDHNSL
jgi:hypothetical protein